MKKLVLSFFALVLFTQANATHLLGGEMYFDKLSMAGQYKLTLLLYRDASGAGLGNTQTVFTDIPGVSSIQLSLVSSGVQSVSMSCNYSSVEVYEYTATFITLTAIPPAGYELYWNSCCRPPGILNLVNSGSKGFDVRIKMLPGAINSARFMNPANTAGVSGKDQYFNHSAYDPDVQDSVYVTLASPKENSSGNTSAIPYNINYSSTKPFGLSVPTTFDPFTGLLQVDSVPQGKYTVAFRVQSYTNGVLTSVIRRDVPFYFDALMDVPSLTLNNLQGATVLAAGNNSYILEMTELDSLSFDLTGTTSQLTNGSPSNITLLGYGTLLDTNSSIVGNCMGNNCAAYSSSNGSFVGAGSVQTYFSFKPDTNFVPAGSHQANHMLSFNAYVQDSCGVDRLSSVVVRLVVNKVGAIYGLSTLSSCYGVGVYPILGGDTSSISWSPTTGVSNPNSGMPLLNPSSTTVYTITHVPTGDAIQLTVNVDSIGPLNFTLVNNGTELVIPGYDSAQVHWFYNGAQLPVSSDTLSLDVTGTYWAEVTSGSCKAYSDTIHATVSAKVSNSNALGNSIHTNASEGSFQFALNQNGNTLENLELIFPDSTSGKTTSLVTVELIEAGSILKTVVATKQSDWLWEAKGINTLLNPGILYEIKVTTDFAQTVMFQPSVLPFTEDNGIVYIASGSYMENGVQISGAYPYVNFEFESALSLDENSIESMLYPNPATDFIEVRVNGNASLDIWDVQGKLVLSHKVTSGDKIEVSHLDAGVYIYAIKSDNAIATGKIIKK